MATVKVIFLLTVDILPSFNITDPEVLPYGLRVHTRSINWIVEQVITKNDHKYYANVKIHNADVRDSKNDISAVEKLYMQYNINPNYRLIYACFGVRFQKLAISFVKQYIHVFSPQFLPIYVNPRNDKIQAYYHHVPEYRTREEFLYQLRTKSKSIVLE